MTLAPTELRLVDDRPGTAPGPSRWLARVVDVVSVAVPTLLLALALAPSHWFTDTDLWRGDGEGHLASIWSLAHEVIPTGSLVGWSDSMFAGYQVNELYPALGATIAAVLSYVVPLVVAYKIVVVVPVLLLPLATWLASRWGGLTGIYPAAAAVLIVPFAFDTGCPACGGSVASAALGEYAYAWGLLLAVLGAGLFARLTRTGRGAVVTTVTLAAAGLAHPLTALWLTAIVAVLAGLARPWREPRLFGRVALAMATAALLAATWWIPFVDGRDYMPSQGARGQTDWLTALFPASWWTDLVGLGLAVAGAWAAWALRSRWLGALAIVTGLIGVLFLLLPDDGPFPRERVVPLWSYGRWMLAAAGLAWLVSLLAQRLSRPLAWAPVVALVVVAAVAAGSWGMVGAVRQPTIDGGPGEGRVLGLRYDIDEFSALPAASFGGYQARADAADFRDLKAVLADTSNLGVCGRLAWDLGTADSPTGGPFSDEVAPWRANVWTDGCLRPLTGVLQDSSGTSPLAWNTLSLASNGGIRMFPWTTPEGFDAERAVSRLQLMGVRWFLTHGGAAEKALVATKALVAGPSHGRWKMWGVMNAPVAQGLSYAPVVIDRRLSSQKLYELDDVYRNAASYLAVPLVTSGESGWPRTDLSSAPQVTKLPGTSYVLDLTGADLTATPDRLTFKVDRPGFPVLVKVSAYPGWTVEGAEGPYRTSTNFLVVVPTSDTVTLTRTRTPAEWMGLVAGVLGLIGLGALVVLGVRDRRRERSSE